MKDVYLVSCCRTAIGTFGGTLKDVPAAQLGSIVAKAALERAGLAAENLDEVMFGCVLTAGQVRTLLVRLQSAPASPSRFPHTQSVWFAVPV